MTQISLVLINSTRTHISSAFTYKPKTTLSETIFSDIVTPNVCIKYIYTIRYVRYIYLIIHTPNNQLESSLTAHLCAHAVDKTLAHRRAHIAYWQIVPFNLRLSIRNRFYPPGCVNVCVCESERVFGCECLRVYATPVD